MSALSSPGGSFHTCFSYSFFGSGRRGGGWGGALEFVAKRRQNVNVITEWEGGGRLMRKELQT